MRLTLARDTGKAKSYQSFPCDIHGDFEIFQIACITAASDRSIAD